MRGGCYQAAGAMMPARDQSLWQMNAVSANLLGKHHISPNQKDQAASSAHRAKLARNVEPVGCAKVAIDHAGSAWHGVGCGQRIWQTIGVCEEPEAWQPAVSIEAGCNRR
jgi:hypothetical protein